ncbi:MAG: squalene synthase HpnC [Proteobacteria bacterium]|nr:squalene synthase HpnC [Pseudomonadota bacterium]MDE3208589.1 squalene synthase HpnC [Pseudomonadota bacterium]
MQKHYENFPVASFFIPKKIRPAIISIYNFARTADDLADEGSLPDIVRLNQLNHLTQDLDSLRQGKTPRSTLMKALGNTISDYQLSFENFDCLLKAFRQDTWKKYYATRTELLQYCQYSANPIGHILLELFNVDTPQNIIWSDSICTGLQLVNFWQDIAIDYKKSRIYLPQDKLNQFQVTESQIKNGDTSGNWWPMLKDQLEDASFFLQQGYPLIHNLPPRFSLELRFIIAGGLKIIEKITLTQGDIFHNRPTIKTVDWFKITLSIIIGYWNKIDSGRILQK